MATNGASDTSELVYSLEKIAKANTTNANSCSLKGAELDNLRTGSRMASQGCHRMGGCGGWQELGREPGNSETLEDVKSKKQLCRHEARGPQSGTESRKALDYHSKTSAGSLSPGLCFQPTTWNSSFVGSHLRPCGSAGKQSTWNAGDLGLIPVLGRSPGEGTDYPLQYSGLENSMDYTAHGVAKSQTRLSHFHFHWWPQPAIIC